MVKLGDFGVARQMQGTASLAQTQIGTPYYLSPEIYEDQPYGKKSDVWSLGVILYELLTLELPFQAKNLAALARKVLTQAPPPINRDDYSEEMQELVDATLEKTPASRPTVGQILRRPFVRHHISGGLS